MGFDIAHHNVQHPPSGLRSSTASSSSSSSSSADRYAASTTTNVNPHRPVVTSHPQHYALEIQREIINLSPSVGVGRTAGPALHTSTTSAAPTTLTPDYGVVMKGSVGGALGNAGKAGASAAKVAASISKAAADASKAAAATSKANDAAEAVASLSSETGNNRNGTQPAGHKSGAQRNLPSVGQLGLGIACVAGVAGQLFRNP